MQSAQFDQSVQLAWGNVAVLYAPDGPSALRVRLKRSKCDQLRKGVGCLSGSLGGASAQWQLSAHTYLSGDRWWAPSSICHRERPY